MPRKMTPKREFLSCDQVYDKLIAPEPHWINGSDFFGLNYGSHYSTLRGNNRKIGLSGGGASYLCVVPENWFPQNAVFHKMEPHMALTEATHVGTFEQGFTGSNLEELVQCLKEKCIKFEE